MDSDRYKWIALSNTTLGVLLATLDASIILIAMPNIFRGIKLDPLVPANSVYLLWMILGYLVVTSVLIVNLWEEMAWAGFFQRRAMYRYGFVTGSLVTAALFVAVHLPLASPTSAGSGTCSPGWRPWRCPASGSDCWSAPWTRGAPGAS